MSRSWDSRRFLRSTNLREVQHKPVLAGPILTLPNPYEGLVVPCCRACVQGIGRTYCGSRLALLVYCVMLAAHTQSVPALDRALTVLEVIAKSKAGLTLSDLVLETGLPKSSAHCLLITLQRRGYLHRNEKNSRYMLDLKLFTLANMALGGMKLRDQAAPFLKALMEKTRLTTHLAILNQQEAAVVAKFEPPGVFRLATWIGKRMDMHCTALGKALIAYLPQEQLDRIIKEHGLPRHNDNTLCSLRKLKDDLARTVQRGYAIEEEEDEIGFCCIGAPIFHPERQPIASISISGTMSQITSEDLTRLGRSVVETARSISQSLVCTSEDAV